MDLWTLTQPQARCVDVSPENLLPSGQRFSLSTSPFILPVCVVPVFLVSQNWRRRGVEIWRVSIRNKLGNTLRTDLRQHLHGKSGSYTIRQFTTHTAHLSQVRWWHSHDLGVRTRSPQHVYMTFLTETTPPSNSYANTPLPEWAFSTQLYTFKGVAYKVTTLYKGPADRQQ